MANKVALINMKGGVGKSTLAVQLAWHFLDEYKQVHHSPRNYKVLVVDLDPQFNASQYLLGATSFYKREIEKNRPTVWDIFEQFTPQPGVKKASLDPASVVWKGWWPDLIPSRLELAHSLKNPAQKEGLLTKFLSGIEDKYDLILLDCAPTESFLTLAAYLSSDYILVPVKPEYLSTIGLPLLANSLDEFKMRHPDHALELLGIVFNQTSGYSPEELRSKREVKKIAKEKGWNIFKNEVSFSRSYPKSAREGQPIFRTSYARTKTADRFRAFANEFAQRLKL